MSDTKWRTITHHMALPGSQDAGSEVINFIDERAYLDQKAKLASLCEAVDAFINARPGTMAITEYAKMCEVRASLDGK